jgi:hypothetical protein
MFIFYAHFDECIFAVEVRVYTSGEEGGYQIRNVQWDIRW